MFVRIRDTFIFVCAPSTSGQSGRSNRTGYYPTFFLRLPCSHPRFRPFQGPDVLGALLHVCTTTEVFATVSSERVYFAPIMLRLASSFPPADQSTPNGYRRHPGRHSERATPLELRLGAAHQIQRASDSQDAVAAATVDECIQAGHG